MTYHHRDRDNDRLTAHGMRDDDGRPVVHLGTSTPDDVYVDVDRVEELVAGIREAARQATRSAP